MRYLLRGLLWSVMFFFITFLYSCVEHKKSNGDIVVDFDDYHKTKKIYDEKGNLTNSYQINLKGQKDGYSYEFFKTQKVKSVSYYKNGLLDSVQTWFYPNSLKQAEIYRLNGKKFGSQNMYDSAGNLEAIYFVTSACDSCITSILNFHPDGSIKQKDGRMVHCIYENEKIKITDTAKMIFYVMGADFFKFSCTLVEKKLGNYVKRDSCKLGFLNHNKGYLFMKNFDKVGEYKIGFVINILNTKTSRFLSDSIFIPLNVIE
jgi:hypothetical protein